MNNDEQLRYPVGKFHPKEIYTIEEVKENIGRIESLPSKIENVFGEFTSKQLNTPYREGGWTGRQVIHHISDSHINAYIRTKWTLTEETPTIKAYDEKAWAETPETSGDPAMSIALLHATHKKWVTLLRQLAPESLERSFIHPENGNEISLARQIATYAWHGEHHLAHLLLILKK